MKNAVFAKLKRSRQMQKKKWQTGGKCGCDKRGAHKCLCNVDVCRALYKEIPVITANEAYSAALFEL